MNTTIRIVIASLIVLGCKDKSADGAAGAASATTVSVKPSVTLDLRGTPLGAKPIDVATLWFDKRVHRYAVRLLLDCPGVTNSCADQAYPDGVLKEYFQFQEKCPNVREVNLTFTNDTVDVPLVAGKYSNQSKPLYSQITTSGKDSTKDYASFGLIVPGEEIVLTKATDAEVSGTFNGTGDGNSKISGTFTATKCKP